MCVLGASSEPAVTAGVAVSGTGVTPHPAHLSPYTGHCIQGGSHLLCPPLRTALYLPLSTSVSQLGGALLELGGALHGPPPKWLLDGCFDSLRGWMRGGRAPPPASKPQGPPLCSPPSTQVPPGGVGAMWSLQKPCSSSSSMLPGLLGRSQDADHALPLPFTPATS